MTPTTLLVISFLVCKNPASLCFDLCRNRLHRVSDHWPHVVIPLFFISYRTNSSFSAKALGEPPLSPGAFASLRPLHFNGIRICVVPYHKEARSRNGSGLPSLYYIGILVRPYAFA